MNNDRTLPDESKNVLCKDAGLVRFLERKHSKYYLKQTLISLIVFFFATVGQAKEPVEQKPKKQQGVEQMMIALGEDAPTGGKLSHSLLLETESMAMPMQSRTTPFRATTVVVFEDFETTINTDLPANWTCQMPTTSSASWVTGSNVGNLGLSAYGGSRYVGVRYHDTENNDAWLFSSAFSLVAGKTYTIGFAVAAIGWPVGAVVEQIDVRIDTLANPAAMLSGELLWSSATLTPMTGWIYVTINYEPTTTGTYYLGFYDYTSNADALIGAIDNVSVTTLSDNDLSLTLGPPYLYAQVPISQIAVTGRANNIGFLPQTVVTLSATLNEASLGTTAPIPALTPGDSTDWLSLPGTGQLGVNTVTCVVAAAESDEHPADNSGTYTFMGTDNVYAYDNLTTFATGIGSSGIVTFGNIFTIESPATLSQVAIGFGPTTTFAYGISLYKVTGELACESTDLLGGATFTRPVSGLTYVTVPETALTPGRYFLGVRQLSSSNIFVSYELNANKLIHVLAPDYTLYAANQGYAVAIRMILASDEPCDAPTNLQVIPGYNSATCSWATDSGAQNYTIHLSDGTTTYTQISASSSTVFSEIPDGTSYTWSVQGTCIGNTSAVIAGTPFSTNICAVVTSFPWLEDFENVIFPPDCWTSFNIDGSGTQWTRSMEASHLGLASAVHAYGSSTVEMQEGWLVTPMITIPETHTGASVLEFWSYSQYPEDHYYNGVWISTTGKNPTSATFTELKQLSGMDEISASWKKISVPLSGYAGQTVNIGFKYMGIYADSWYIDDVAITIDSSLYGVYTIDNTLPTAGRNFNSFEEAIYALNTRGISDTVTFEVIAGQVHEIALTDYRGLRIVSGGTVDKPITFIKSGTGDNPLLKVAGTSNTYADACFYLENVSYITFDGLDIENAGTASSNYLERGFHLQSANNITIQNCVVKLPQNSMNLYGIYISQGNNNTIKDCNIELYYNTSAYGIYTTGTVNNFTIKETKITNAGTGIQLSYGNNQRIFNNVIHAASIGISLDYSNTTDTIHLAHNTVYIPATANTGYCLSTYFSGKLGLYNNIFINKSTSTSSCGFYNTTSDNSNILPGSNNNIYYCEWGAVYRNSAVSKYTVNE
ncbi:MAG: choice-of-anchor J domain-containing protein, partial [Bacteroidales bacterium]|nr:choice-of-anchor J domain-containing protein [Bacteroidales bacterium]